MFVAGFIGSPPMNFIEASLLEDAEGNLWLDAGDLRITLPADISEALRELGYAGKEVIFGIRPEDIYDISLTKGDYPGVKAKVDVVEPLGSELIVHLNVGNIKFVAKFHKDSKVKEGEEIEVGFDLKQAHFFDKHTKKVIL